MFGISFAGGALGWIVGGYGATLAWVVCGYGAAAGDASEVETVVGGADAGIIEQSMLNCCAAKTLGALMKSM